MATRMKLWVGIGACVLVGTGQTAAADASDPFQPVTTATSTQLLAHGGEGSEGGETSHGGEGGEASHGGEGGEAGHGGEGGEGGEAGALSHLGGGEGGEGGEGSASAPAAVNSPGVYYATLLFMKGHLWVAEELYTSGNTEIGSAHMGHPYAEHFDSVEDALEERGVTGIHDALEHLAEEAGSQPDWSALEPAYQEAQSAIDRAIASLDPSLREDPDFIADVALGVLRKAAHEYEEAISDGEFVNVVEYHDGRGFAHVTRKLLEDHADVLKAADADTYETLLADVDRILEAWPSAMPPEKPAVSTSELAGNVSRFELHANNL
ncbi:hypothetical protein [Arhodomonas sp. AD133]|uniref:hypothetical protein n=1 Tax=Arhodomonas sp. AD133 TaxID=3415009 RepID=UPI003EB9442D